MKIEKRDADLARKFVGIGVNLTKLFIVSLVLQHPDTDHIDDERLLYISNKIAEFYMNDDLNGNYPIEHITEILIMNYKDICKRTLIKANDLTITEIIDEYY